MSISCKKEVDLIRQFRSKLEASKNSQIRSHEDSGESKDTVNERGLDLSTEEKAEETHDD